MLTRRRIREIVTEYAYRSDRFRYTKAYWLLETTLCLLSGGHEREEIAGEVDCMYCHKTLH